MIAACDVIYVPPAGVVGSIGVMDVRLDASRVDAAMGLNFALIYSGARKVDGNPHRPVSEDELSVAQARVDELAALFFGTVADLRPNLSSEKLRGFQAGVFIGQNAVTAGLADRVASFDEVIAGVTAPQAKDQTMAAAEDKDKDESEYAKARAVLAKIAAGDGDDAARARKALAAMDHGEPDGDEPKDDKAEGDGEPDGDEPKDKDKAVSADASTVALLKSVQTLSAEVQALKSVNAAAAMDQFLAGRPDLAPETVAFLRTKPLAEAKAFAATIKVPAKPTLGDLAAASGTVGATRGEGQETAAVPGASAEATAMDQAMGLAKYKLGVAEKSATAMTFGLVREASAAPAAGGSK